MCLVFFFNDTATTEIYTLSLHDALPISDLEVIAKEAALRHHHAFPDRQVNGHTLDVGGEYQWRKEGEAHLFSPQTDRKSTRLNSSHANISYAVFCLKKKKKKYLR